MDDDQTPQDDEQGGESRAQHVANTRMQNGMRDARTHVNRQKSRDGIEPPRTVDEQLEELVSRDAEGHRRRDPQKAAKAQRRRRDNGVGGAWIDTSQRANDPDPEIADELQYEKLPGRHGDDE